MNKLTIGNIWAKIEGPGLDAAWSILRYRSKGYFYTQAFKRGSWDGYNDLLNYKTGMFPAGLVPYVQEKIGGEWEIKDERITLHSTPQVWTLRGELMAHQQSAVAACIEHERGIIEHPVAAGKSRTAIALAAALGQPTLVLVHRKDLLSQFVGGTQENDTGIRDLIPSVNVGCIGNGVFAPSKEITVATFQSLWAGIKKDDTVKRFLETIRLVEVDEVHHVMADTFSAIMKLLVNARYRIGFSATPFKSEKENEETYLRVVSWLGPVIHQVTPSEGVDIGRLVPATIFFIKDGWYPSLDELPWQEEYQEGIVRNIGRNDSIVRLAETLRQRAPVLILCERIEHGKILSERLRCPFLRGETELTARVKGWQGIRDGTLDCVVATSIADEGIDIPGIQGIILAGGGKAKHKMIQRIGRGQRADGEKDKVWVFDFEDEGEHLSKHSQSRIELYRQQEAYTLVEATLEEVLQ